MHKIPIRCCGALAALTLAAPGNGAEISHIAIAPAKARVSAELAVQFELKIRLQDGRGLARSLLDLGVQSNDAAVAARLGAGHMGDGAGGCEATVSLSRAAAASGYRLVRIRLSTQSGETVIERRSGELAIASQAAANRSLRLI
jgi:hypothetical protein